MSSRASRCDDKEALRINEYVYMSIRVYIRAVFTLQCNLIAQRRHRLDASRAGSSDATRVSGRLFPISPYHRGRFPFHFRLTTLQRLPLVFFTPYEKVLHAASRVR